MRVQKGTRAVFLFTSVNTGGPGRGIKLLLLLLLLFMLLNGQMDFSHVQPYKRLRYLTHNNAYRYLTYYILNTFDDGLKYFVKIGLNSCLNRRTILTI